MVVVTDESGVWSLEMCRQKLLDAGAEHHRNKSPIPSLVVPVLGVAGETSARKFHGSPSPSIALCGLL